MFFPNYKKTRNMTLTYIWTGFFLVGFIAALAQWLFLGDVEVFKRIIDGTFAAAKLAVMDIALPLAGIMTLWLGILAIGEKAGAINLLARIIAPFFSRIFPEVPKDHPATGHMVMNFSANFLGLDNAATPFGLKAMESLQTLNPSKDEASNAQIMFLVLHTSGLTLIPLSIMAQRAILGAKDASDIFIPTLIATYVATVVSMVAVAIKQRINLFDRVDHGLAGRAHRFIIAVIWYMTNFLTKPEIEVFSKVVSNLILFSIIVGFIIAALRKRVDVYDAFIEGAKGGIETSLKIIPYLVGMLVAISVLRNSGILGFVVERLHLVFHAARREHRFHAGPADRADEADQRLGLAGDDDRCDADLRRRFIRRPAGVHLPGFSRYDFLHRGAVFRLGRHQEDALRDHLRADRRFRWRGGGDLRGVPVFSLNKNT